MKGNVELLLYDKRPGWFPLCHSLITKCKEWHSLIAAINTNGQVAAGVDEMLLLESLITLMLHFQFHRKRFRVYGHLRAGLEACCCCRGGKTQLLAFHWLS